MYNSPHTPQPRGTFLQRKHDLLPAHSPVCQILVPVAVNLFQSAFELLDRDRFELSVLDQTRDVFQKLGELSPVVVVQTERFELEAVCGEYNCDCEENRFTIRCFLLMCKMGKMGRTYDFYVFPEVGDSFCRLENDQESPRNAFCQNLHSGELGLFLRDGVKCDVDFVTRRGLDLLDHVGIPVL